MTPTKPFPFDLFEMDQVNSHTAVDLLKKHGIYELYEQVVPGLFRGLVPAVKQNAPPGFFPFTRTTAGGLEVPTYDFILRLVMLQSAHEQFVFALGHLFRGHASEVPGHLRRAIESAGIAYLSKSKPELGEPFMSGDEKKFRNATNATAILPPGDPVTAPLLESMNFASMLTHNNFITFASRTQQSLKMEGTKWTLSLGLDLYGSTTLGAFLRLALWFLRVMERVLRVFAASFGLPSNCDWSKQLEQFKAWLDKLYVDLDDLARPLNAATL